jgi:DNA-binding PadR family transcriptional regulator
MQEDVLTRKILILTANPKDTDKLRLDEEARNIKEGLRQSKERDCFVIETEWAIRAKDVRRSILHYKPEIVHFSGHGAEVNGLVFENEVGKVQLISTEGLAGLFELFSNHVKCVILNACFSEIQAEAMSQHIDYVIGMSEAINDQAAVEFSVGFYDALGAGCSYEIAFKFGCNAIHLAGISQHSIPVLKKKNDLATIFDVTPIHEAASKNGLAESNSTVRSCIAENQSKAMYEFVITGKVNDISRQQLEAIVVHLQKTTGDTSITLLKVEEGSIKLILEGSEEGFYILQSLINSGELDQILDFPIETIGQLNSSGLPDNEKIELHGSENLLTETQDEDLVEKENELRQSSPPTPKPRRGELSMKFKDIYHFFQEPPPIYLSKEVAVCYVLSVLLEQGDSYVTALIHLVESEYPMYRLSDSVLLSVLKFLEDESVIEGYWQKVEGRHKPRRYYHIQAEKIDFARQLSSLWTGYVQEQTQITQNSSSA